MVDYEALAQLILRWIHFVAGVTWIGLLYYFNVVQGPAFKVLDGPVRSQNIQRLVPRALFYFRWGAVVTVLAGIALLSMEWETYSNSDVWTYNILAGGALGILMFLNVWLIIWPNQKKVIAANVEATQRQQPVGPATANWAKRAFLASRANLIVSFPMLYFMGAAQHGGAFTVTESFIVGGVILVLGLLWLWVWTRPKTATTPAPPSAPQTPRT